MNKPTTHSQAPWFLALDTSTEALSIALGAVSMPGGTCARQPASAQPEPQLWQYSGAGGAHSSATLIPEAMRLLQQAGLRLQDLQALVVGVGPGSFTGLRTACSVAQGLALGTGLPVLPVGTLLAVAEDWRHRQAGQQQQGRVWALLDARMDEIYAACWQWQACQAAGADDRDDAVGAGHVQWQCVQAPVLVAPENLTALPGVRANDCWAGNVQAAYGARLPVPVTAAMPTASALLRLAPALWQQGAAVDAALLLPHYVRDKVAQTTAKRAAAQAARKAQG